MNQRKLLWIALGALIGGSCFTEAFLCPHHHQQQQLRRQEADLYIQYTGPIVLPPLLLPYSKVGSSTSALAAKPPRRWGGMRRRIEGGDDDASGRKRDDGDDEEDDIDETAISDAMIDEVMKRKGLRGSGGDTSIATAGAGTSKFTPGQEPAKWSMEWLETLSEEEMVGLDKKRLLDFLMKDIEVDKEWASVPDEAVFAPDEEIDEKENMYDEALTESIFGKMPDLEALDYDDEEDDDDLDLEDIFGEELEDDDEDESDEDLMRLLSGSSAFGGAAVDGEFSDDEEDDDVDFDGDNDDAWLPLEDGDGMRRLLAGLGGSKLNAADAGPLMAAAKACLEAGDRRTAAELLQRMEELGLEVGDLEDKADALEAYRQPLTKVAGKQQKKQLNTPSSSSKKAPTAAAQKEEKAAADGPDVALSGGILSPDEVEAMKSVGACVGIDLGTTNSALSLIKDGRAIILPSRETGDNVVPSVVRFGSDGTMIVGKVALDEQLEDAENTFTSVKRLIGRSLEELVKEKEILEAVNLVAKDEQVAMYCPALRREVTPEEVSAAVLKALLKDAEDYLGQAVNRAVITVPAYFTPEQCEATKKAGQLAGLKRIKLLREPEAAALAYGLDKLEDELIMVFDLGGGTFDVSVLEIGDGMVEVLATFGDNHLGGNDFDKRIADWIAAEFRKQYNMNPPSDRTTYRRLLEAGERLKVRLSNAPQAELELKQLAPGKDLKVSLDRQQMENLCQDLYDRLLFPMRQAALMAGATLTGEVAPETLGDDELDELDFDINDRNDEASMGKMARLMRERALKGRQISKARSNYNKNLSAVRKRNPSVKVREFPQGRSLSEVVMVGGATRMPSIQRLVEAVTGIKPRTTVNPDEAVALGAGIHAGVLDGTIEDVEMMTPIQAAILRGLADYESRQEKEDKGRL